MLRVQSYTIHLVSSVESDLQNKLTIEIRSTLPNNYVRYSSTISAAQAGPKAISSVLVVHLNIVSGGISIL
jgi:hypothetical protein